MSVCARRHPDGSTGNLALTAASTATNVGVALYDAAGNHQKLGEDPLQWVNIPAAGRASWTTAPGILGRPERHCRNRQRLWRFRGALQVTRARARRLAMGRRTPSEDELMKIRATTWMTAVLAGAVALPGSAAVTLQGTRIVHDAAQGRDVTVKASNGGDKAAMVQVWIDDGDSHARPENVRTPFRLTPAGPRLLQAHQGQAYRISTRRARRRHRCRRIVNRCSTSTCWIFRPNPPMLPAEPAAVRRTHAGEAVPSPGRPARQAARCRRATAMACAGRRPAGEQPSAYHVTLSTLTLPDGHTVETDMVAPGAELRLPLPVARRCPRR